MPVYYIHNHLLTEGDNLGQTWCDCKKIKKHKFMSALQCTAWTK